MNMSEILKITGIIALIRFLSLIILSHIFTSPTETLHLPYFYNPTLFITIFALLIFGYCALPGIVLGELAWNMHWVPLSSATHLGLMTALFCGSALSYCIYSLLINPERAKWKRPTFEQIVSFVMLHSGILLLSYQIIFFLIPEIDPLSLENLAVVFVNNVLTCLIVIVALNICASLMISFMKLSNPSHWY